jgi:hypothetical protein
MDQHLSPGHATAVARRIDHLADQPGVPLNAELPGPPGSSYLAAVPDDDDAPVVIYRSTAAGEEGDFLVTALVDRVAGADFAGAARPGAAGQSLDRAAPARAGRLGLGRISPPVGL